MDHELDYQILASALLQEGAAKRYSLEIDPDSVGKAIGSFGIYQLFANMMNCYRETGELNPASFHSWIENFPEVYSALGEAKGYKELMERLSNTEFPSSEGIIKLVNRRYAKVKTLQKIQDIKGALDDDLIDDDRIDTLSTELHYALQENKEKTDFKIRTANDIADNVDELWDQEVFIPTQFPDLNEALGYDKEKGGMMRGCIYAIVANSGFGKSTLSKNLCNHWLDHGQSVLFINFEESQTHWEKILMTQITGTNVYKDITSAEAARVTEQFKAKLKEWGDRFMIRHDPDSLYYEDLEIWIRKLVNEHPNKPDIVVIDTIQSLFAKGGKARWGEFEQIMVRMEKLAKELNAVFLIPTQQNNNAVRESRTEVNQSDIGGSVTIVQKASVIMVITERKKDNELDGFDSENDDGVMEIQIPKNRIAGKGINRAFPMIKYEDEIKSYIPWDLSKDKEQHKEMMISLNKADISPV